MVDGGDHATTRLARWIVGLRWDDVPPAQHELLAARVMDTVGLIVAGHGSAVRPALDAYAARLAAGPCTTIGRAAGTAPEAAALVHGIRAHARDFDDTFTDSVVHPGSVVIAAALAVAEAERSSPAEFGAAVAAGYEVAARVGQVAGRRFHARGLHATGIVGPLAAAAAAARLRRLGAQACASALGLAASMSGGLMAFQEDGAWSKWLHAGWAAHGGVVATDLAAGGFVGPAGALTGRHNLYDALLAGEAVDAATLTAGLGTAWAGAEARFKYYPCAHVIQPYIDALFAIVAAERLDAADVAEIRCAVAPWIVPIVCEPRAPRLRPPTEMDAIASLYYQLAYALHEGRVDLAALDADARGRADLHRLADRVSYRADDALTDDFQAVVEVVTRDGRRHAARATAVTFDRPRLDRKFLGNAGAAVGAEAAAAFVARLAEPGPPDWRAATDLLRKAGGPSADSDIVPATASRAEARQ